MGAALAGLQASASADPIGVLATCSSWTNSAGTIAYGDCSGDVSGIEWRLGVVCEYGYYYWSPWQRTAHTKSYDCPGQPGKVTSHWVDIRPR